MDPPAQTEGQPLAQTPQQRYRQSEKCKLARERYYANKGKQTAHEYYEKNKELILSRSKERYLIIKANNNLENNLT
jgi:retron-type reverse transcriptase